MDNSSDPIKLEIYKHLFAAVAEEMGAVLRKASYSPNIKERRDFSCALFDRAGSMVAQAEHIPVHLGSMPLSVLEAINNFGVEQKTGEQGPLFPAPGARSLNVELMPGDVIILNDPFRGGTHLPDITLVTPVFLPSNVEEPGGSNMQLIGFVASRAHHADVGGITPGSMPVSKEIYQEGLIIPPVKIFHQGVLNRGVWDMIIANVRTPGERAGDLLAQIAANQRGATRFIEIVDRYGLDEIYEYMGHLLSYTERMTRQLIANLPDGTYRYTDYLDSDGINEEPVKISVAITIVGDTASVDFSGSDNQQAGSVNAVYAITLSAVYYVMRALLGLDVPNNTGCLAPVAVIAPAGSVVNANPPAAVAGGNVETSQRIVDTLFGALAQAAPDRVPSASQGTMNNVTIGGYDQVQLTSFAYYETIGGGMGARPTMDGPSAVHSHMTNTLNTPVEALEFAYPLRIQCYSIREGSGGGGQFKGGNGICRDIQVLVDSQVTLLTERRRFPPYGLNGGEPGLPGKNLCIRGDEITLLPGKGTFLFQAGDVLSIRTPGGGGYGS